MLVMMSELPSFTLSCHSACPSSGAHALLNISSKPTLAELDKFKVRSITDGWEQVLLHLGPLLEVVRGNGSGALVVIMILLLQNGDLETNPGPVERGGWLCLECTCTSSSRHAG